MTVYRLLSSPISKTLAALAIIVIGWPVGPGQFTYVTAVAVAENGTVFVADYGNNGVQKWRSMTDMVGQL